MRDDRGTLSGEGDNQALLRQVRFRRFALAKFLQMTGQNALVYGLFIAFFATSDSSVATSAFVLAAVLPSIVLSVPGGIVGDALPKKLTIVAVLAARMALVWAFIDFSPGLGLVLVLTLILWSLYQFYTPPENVALLAVAGRERLASATSFIQALSLVAQVVGAGVVAPLILKLVGRQGLFYTVEALFAASLVIYVVLPRLTPPAPPRSIRLGLWQALPRGLRVLRASSGLSRMTILRAVLDSGMMMLMVAAPAFIRDSLRTGAENAVYIAMPGAMGLGLGLALAPLLVSLFRPALLVATGYMTFLLAVLALAFVGDVSSELADLTSPLADAADAVGLSREVFATALVLPFAGFGLSLVQVSSRVAVLRAVAPGLIGQVMATQSAVGSVVALAPTFLAGVLFDAVPVRAGLLVIAATLAAGGIVVLISPPLLGEEPADTARGAQGAPEGNSADQEEGPSPMKG